MPPTLSSIVDSLSDITEELLGPYVESGKLPKENLSKIYVIVQRAMMDLENIEVDQEYHDDQNPPPKGSKYQPKDLSSKGMKMVPGQGK